MDGWRRTAARSVLGLGFALMAAMPAGAQIMPGQTGFKPMVKPNEPTQSDSRNAAAALPGATPGLGAAPADKTTADLSPNDALFDAINRGDIGEARDAVNRGADIHMPNVLGMTPLELSVDLSRNDITFFLLSLGGASSGSVAAKAAAPVPSVVAMMLPAKATKAATRTPVPRAAPAAAPRQYAVSSNPGTPDPQVGFLGFGAASR